MKKIEVYEQLQEEKRLTKQRIERLELLIELDVAEIKSSIDPWKSVSHTLKSMLSSEQDGIIGESIGLSVDALIKRILLRKSNWAFKFMIAFLFKNYTKNLLSKNAENIIEWVKMKLRTKKSDHSKEFYDESTSYRYSQS